MRIASQIAEPLPFRLKAGTMGYCGVRVFLRGYGLGGTHIDAITGSKRETIPD
jgi:hypothetical protein